MSLTDDGSAYGRSLNAIFDPRLNGSEAANLALPPMPAAVRIGLWAAIALAALIMLWKISSQSDWMPADLGRVANDHSLELSLLFWGLFLGQDWVSRRYRRPSKARP